MTIEAISRESESIALLDSLGDIRNKQDCLAWLERLSGREMYSVGIEKINNWGTKPYNRYYYDMNGKEVDATSPRAKYMLVRTPLTELGTGNELFFAFYRNVSFWVGARVGTFFSALRATMNRCRGDNRNVGVDFETKIKFVRPPKYEEAVKLYNDTHKVSSSSVKKNKVDKVEDKSEVSVEKPVKDNVESAVAVDSLKVSNASETDTVAKPVITSSVEDKVSEEKVSEVKVQEVRSTPTIVQRMAEYISTGKSRGIEQTKSENRASAPVPTQTDTSSQEEDPSYDFDDGFVSDASKQYLGIDATAFIDKLSSMLLLQNFLCDDRYSLRVHLNVVVTRILAQAKVGARGLSKYVRFNKEGTKMLFNLGLLNKYAQEIYICASVSKGIQSWSAHSYEIVSDKSALLGYGFAKKDILSELVRVPLYDNEKQLVFSGSIDEFDFTEQGRFMHCIEKRITRYPRRMQGMSLEILSNDLINAIKTAIKINQFDKQYIKPIYECKSNTLGYAFPYYVGGDYHREPELGIVIKYKDGFWKLGTILPIKALKADVSAMFPYSSDWCGVSK